MMILRERSIDSTRDLANLGNLTSRTLIALTVSNLYLMNFSNGTRINPSDYKTPTGCRTQFGFAKPLSRTR
jgi:hypothetical protein